MIDARILDAPPTDPTEIWARFAFSVFLRLLSVVFLVLTLMVWASAVGYLDNSLTRFDTMPTQTRIYVAVLAVLNPVACVGLWATLSWGRTVWLIASAFQLGFVLTDPSVTQYPDALVAFHLSCLTIYVAMRLLLHRVANKE
ncbi:MAG: DUF6163 family protein [Ahrensia sp.]|nr:DUF6163 family protein [Ahrensia sp.]